MKKIGIFVSLLFAAILLVGCNSKKSQPKVKERIIVAKMQSPVKHLYFTGTIQPIKTVSVLSPADGRIENLNFTYGETVKKHQLLATLNSAKMMDNFRTAVSSFLSKKTDYLNQAEQFEGTKILYKAGVMDKEDFTSAKNTYENSILDYYQELYALRKVLKKAGVNEKEIEGLNISETKKIQMVFARALNKIKVFSPMAGVALFPLPQAGQGGSESANTTSSLASGAQVHEGQLILSIGNLAGFSIDMKINEVNINSIKKGMKAVITGNAFRGVVLHGYVYYVASQAEPSQSGEQSSGSVFKVSVTVPKVIDKELLSVHVGMTAKIDIPLKGKPRIMLPINAVFRKKGQSYVTVVDANGRHKAVTVVTGETTPTGVSILRGIKSGQKVVVRD